VSKQWWFRKREEMRVLRRVMYMKRVENREQNLENATGGNIQWREIIIAFNTEVAR